MKKITLAIALLTLGAQAQDFPSPYCEMTEGSTVEAITAITFAETSISNDNDTSILIDKTATVANAAPGATYAITVEGNTEGNFDTEIVAYIDWNQNEILDDATEVYPVGTLSNSTGSDGISVTTNITAPADAVLGTTRIRVTKTYTDPEAVAVENPCAIEMEIAGFGVFPGFGQALDFTLNVGTLSTDQFDTTALSYYPTAIENELNIHYSAVLKTVSVYNLLGQEIDIKHPTTAHVQLDLSTLDTGIYMVTLVAEQGQHSFKIIKR